ncbi:MAG: hypothetical protein FJW14_00185 [Acidimicrobiia bacterium]|nr:hypothetical protein [Acidimicrobiia bacterium]
MLNRARRFGLSALAALAVALMASPAAAQDAAPVVVVTGGIDFVNQYNFRGIRQNTEGVSVWPFVDFGFTPFRGDGSLKTVNVNIGTWNAIHSQINDGNKLYETDFYGTLGFGFSRGALAFTYTSYTSPADLFAHVKELSVKASFDDSAALGRGALKPYALVAFEMDNQADAGDSTGTYIELGIAPGISGSRASLAIPVKVGLSGSDYYEFATGSDSTFGYFSVGGLVTVPMGSHANIHGGVEFQAFGDTVSEYNGQDTAGIVSIGLGFAF